MSVEKRNVSNDDPKMGSLSLSLHLAAKKINNYQNEIASCSQPYSITKSKNKDDSCKISFRIHHIYIQYKSYHIYTHARYLKRIQRFTVID